MFLWFSYGFSYGSTMGRPPLEKWETGKALEAKVDLDSFKEGFDHQRGLQKRGEKRL